MLVDESSGTSIKLPFTMTAECEIICNIKEMHCLRPLLSRNGSLNALMGHKAGMTHVVRDLDGPRSSA